VSNVGVRVLSKLMERMKMSVCDDWAPKDLLQAVESVIQENAVGFKEHILYYFSNVYCKLEAPFHLVPYYVKRVDKRLSRRRHLLLLIDPPILTRKRPRQD
jgi:hypothetical protein